MSVDQNGPARYLMVGVNVTVVPDGFGRDEAGQTTLRLSLSLTPDVRPTASPRFPITDWPSEVAKYAAAGIRLAVAKVDPANEAAPISSAAYVSCLQQSDVGTTFAAEAAEVWRRIFRSDRPDPEETGFRALIADLTSAQVPGAAAAAAAAEPPNEALGTFEAAGLATVVDAIYGAATATALDARLAALGGAQVSPGALGVAAVSDRGVEIGNPQASWWHRLHQNWLATASPSDSVARLALASSPPPDGLAAAAAEPASDLIGDVIARMKTAAVARRSAGARAQSESAVAADANSLSSLSQAAAFFDAQAMRPSFWRTGVSEAAAAATASQVAAPNDRVIGATVRQEIAKFRIVRGMAMPTVAESEDPEQQDRDYAPRRKLTAIMSFPTLAKYLRMIVDVEVKWSEIAAAIGASKSTRVYGAIAADLVSDSGPRCRAWHAPDPRTLHWTSFVLQPADAAARQYFGPCSRHDTSANPAGPDNWFKDGVIDLRVRVTDARGQSVPRFALTTVAVSNTVLELMQRAEEINRRHVEGVPTPPIKLPNVQSRGIALNDVRPPAPSTNTPADTNPAVKVSYAEDLTLGYRIDAALAKSRVGWPDRTRWRSLVARDVGYHTGDIPEKFASDPLVTRTRGREDGHVRHARGEARYLDQNNELVVRTEFQTLFTWTGESLGAPSLHHEACVNNENPDARTVVPRPDLDLAIGITYDLPNANRTPPAEGQPAPLDRRPAPLREGAAYLFGARALFVNGCGLSLDDAVAAYERRDAVRTDDGTTRPVVLGDTSGAAYPYERRHEIQAPDVCLEWSDRLVSAKSGATPPGEAIDVVVVGGGRHGATARRLLVPGRGTFDQSEQAGVFDNIENEDRPAGAFVKDALIQLDPDTGALPVARGGRWSFDEAHPAPDLAAAKKQAECRPQTPRKQPRRGPAPEEAFQSRGSVVVFDASADRPGVEFYPDPLGAQLCARFMVDDQPAPDFSAEAQPVPFWEAAGPLGAKPILVELRTAARGEGKGCAGWFERPNTRARLRAYRGGHVDVQRLVVRLEPGETADVELWSTNDDVKKLRGTHWSLRRALEILQARPASPTTQSLLASEVELNTAIGRALAVAPMAQLQNKRVIRVVHAIEQPLDPPAIATLVPIVLTVRPNSEPMAGASRETLPAELLSWRAYVDMHERQPNLAKWPSDRDGSVTFFVGELQVHRPSTSRVSCEAYWKEYGGEHVHLIPGTDRWAFSPAATGARLFAVDHIRTEAAFRQRPIDLLRPDKLEPGATPEQALRSLAYAFPNGKARHLWVKATATSRFSAFFDPRRRDDTTPDERFDKPSAAKEIWVPATFRPQPPEVDRVMPVFHWTEKVEHHGRSITFTRESFLRIHLKRRTWHSTGEGEMLAIAFGPSTNGKTALDLCGFEQAVGPFAPFVARWGSDPIRLSASLNPNSEPLLPMSRFAEQARQTTHTAETPFSDEMLKSTQDPRATSPPWPRGYTAKRDKLLLPLGPDAVVTKITAGACVNNQLPAQSTVTIEGRNFSSDASLRVYINDVVEITPDPNDVQPERITVKTPEAVACPLKVSVKNPQLPVSIIAYEPRFDSEEGQFYCDVTVEHGGSYYPFIQFGLTRYQEHCAPDLELSPPATAWAQVPPRRDGQVTITDDRKVVLRLHGVGFTQTDGVTGPDRERSQKPLLNVRLMRASSPEHVPHEDDGGISWLPAANGIGTTVIRRPPHHFDGPEAWWIIDEIRMPPCRAGVRYGLLIEEVELMAADPEDPSAPVCGSLPNRTVERGPMFSHIVDLGE